MVMVERQEGNSAFRRIADYRGLREGTEGVVPRRYGQEDVSASTPLVPPVLTMFDGMRRGGGSPSQTTTYWSSPLPPPPPSLPLFPLLSLPFSTGEMTHGASSLVDPSFSFGKKFSVLDVKTMAKMITGRALSMNHKGGHRKKEVGGKMVTAVKKSAPLVLVPPPPPQRESGMVLETSAGKKKPCTTDSADGKCATTAIPILVSKKEVFDEKDFEELSDNAESGRGGGGGGQCSYEAPFFAGSLNQTECVTLFGLPTHFRLRDARRMLFSQCNENQMQYIHSSPVHHNALSKFPRRVTASRFATSCILVAFHLSALRGIHPHFWTNSNQNRLLHFASPNIVQWYHPDIGLGVFRRRDRLDPEAAGEPFEKSLEVVWMKKVSIDFLLCP